MSIVPRVPSSGTLDAVSPTARRILVVLAAAVLARGALHWTTFQLPVSNDDAILLLMGQAVLRGELATTLWNQPYNGALDAYLLAPLLAAAPAPRRLSSVPAAPGGAAGAARLPAGPTPGRPGSRMGGRLPGGVGDAVHGAHDRHRPAAQLPDAARHRLPALAALEALEAPAPGRGRIFFVGLVCGLAVWNSALAIPAFAGMALGLALAGLRPRAAPALTFGLGLALGVTPLVVARLIGASGASVVTASSAVTDAAAALAVGAGAPRPRAGARGVPRALGAARRRRQGAGRAAGRARRARSPAACWSPSARPAARGSRYPSSDGGRRSPAPSGCRAGRDRTTCATSTA